MRLSARVMERVEVMNGVSCPALRNALACNVNSI